MMQILGGMGMAKELPLEHWFRGAARGPRRRGPERDPPLPARARDPRRGGDGQAALISRRGSTGRRPQPASLEL